MAYGLTDQSLSGALASRIGQNVCVIIDTNGVSDSEGVLVQVADDHIVVADDSNDCYIPIAHITCVNVSRPEK